MAASWFPSFVDSLKCPIKKFECFCVTRSQLPPVNTCTGHPANRATSEMMDVGVSVFGVPSTCFRYKACDMMRTVTRAGPLVSGFFPPCHHTETHGPGAFESTHATVRLKSHPKAAHNLVRSVTLSFCLTMTTLPGRGWPSSRAFLISSIEARVHYPSTAWGQT